MGSLVDITLVNRWNVGRVSDAVLFMLGNCGLRSLVSMLDALPMVVLVSRLLLSGVIYPARNSVATYKPVAAAVSTKPTFFLTLCDGYTQFTQFEFCSTAVARLHTTPTNPYINRKVYVLSLIF